MSLLEALKKIQAKPNPNFGICNNLLNQGCHADLTPRFRRWPLFSGSNDYPVPHPNLSPKEAYAVAVRTETLWADTPYGASRRNLLQYLIDELTLKEVLDQIPSDFSANYGVCHYLKKHNASAEVFLRLSLSWPLHSTTYISPVPSPVSDMTSFEYYFEARDRGDDLWAKNTPYGRDRWALVNFIKELIQ